MQLLSLQELGTSLKDLTSYAEYVQKARVWFWSLPLLTWQWPKLKQSLGVQEELPFAQQVAEYPVRRAPVHMPTFAEQHEVC